MAAGQQAIPSATAVTKIGPVSMRAGKTRWKTSY
jgi:hypothetical protein